MQLDLSAVCTQEEGDARVQLEAFKVINCD